MRSFGANRSLGTFRWDLLYLFSQLSTDERPGIADLATPIEAGMNDLETRRVALDHAHAAAIKAAALVAKRDKKRDRLILELGGITRATGRNTYKQLFPKLNPSETAKLGIDAESAEVTRILGEMKTLDPAHPLRKGYETTLADAQADLSQAKTMADDADIALKLERSQVHRCKVDLDKLRVETHGKLVALLADKNEADAFFRPAAHASDETESD